MEGQRQIEGVHTEGRDVPRGDRLLVRIVELPDQFGQQVRADEAIDAETRGGHRLEVDR